MTSLAPVPWMCLREEYREIELNKKGPQKNFSFEIENKKASAVKATLASQSNLISVF